MGILEIQHLLEYGEGEMELKAGLYAVDPSELETLAEAANLSGWTVFELDGRGIVDRKSFFDVACATLPMDPPLQSDRSWDALSDSLWGGIDALPSRRIFIVWKESSSMSRSTGADYEIAKQILSDVATSLGSLDCTAGNPKEVCVVLA